MDGRPRGSLMANLKDWECPWVGKQVERTADKQSRPPRTDTRPGDDLDMLPQSLAIFLTATWIKVVIDFMS
jgi:hypothetical protein